jgi:hypothetical protein
MVVIYVVWLRVLFSFATQFIIKHSSSILPDIAILC